MSSVTCNGCPGDVILIDTANGRPLAVTVAENTPSLTDPVSTGHVHPLYLAVRVADAPPAPKATSHAPAKHLSSHADPRAVKHTGTPPPEWVRTASASGTVGVGVGVGVGNGVGEGVGATVGAALKPGPRKASDDTL